MGTNYIDDVTKKIIKDMMNYSKSISFTVHSKRDIQVILDKVRYESVTTFHVGDFTCTYQLFLRRVTIRPKYVYSQKDYNSLVNKILLKLKEIRNKLIHLPSDLEKEKYIHDYLCKNVVYKENGPDSHCLLGPLFKGEGVCEGIAKTAHALLKIAKINTHIICGEAIDINNVRSAHAWNVVEINGKWHLLDVTFDNNLSDPDFVRYDYFNLSAKEFSASHRPFAHCQDYFNSATTSRSYFLTNNCEFSSLNDVKQFIQREVSRKNKNIYFKMNNKSVKLDEKDLADYILQLPAPTYVYYLSDQMMGVYYYKVKY